MKRLALAAAGAALVGLTGCGSHSAAPSGAPAQHHTSTSVKAKPIATASCRHQYRAWTKGEGRGVMVALHGVSSAAHARDARMLSAALKQAKPAVVTAAKHPIPACADPRGYWSPLLMHVNAAASGTASASSVRAALHGVPKLMNQLVTDVKQTAS